MLTKIFGVVENSCQRAAVQPEIEAAGRRAGNRDEWSKKAR